MPQMAPYNWLILFLLFNLLMMFIITYNHYNSIKLINKPLNKIKKLNFKWMW